MLSKPALRDVVLTSLSDVGLRPSLRGASHPFEIDIEREGRRRRLRVYIWNATHGGGPRSANEYRIQITGVDLPMTAPADTQVLLLGWHGDLGVFAAFDPILHRNPSSLSPSLQIPLSSLEPASLGRLASHIRGNGERAIAFLPRSLMQYVIHQRDLHRSADEPQEVVDRFDAMDERTGQGAESATAREVTAELAGRHDGAPATSGQRIQLDTATRQAVELHAMEAAIVHFEQEDWDVNDVSRFSSYDLECVRGDRVLRVEVKGTMSEGRSVLLTPNEVRHAQTTSAELALFIVANIRVEPGPEGPVAIGGDVLIVSPWSLSEDHLHPVAYEYFVPVR